MEELQLQIRRWKIVAFVAVALSIGFVVGSLVQPAVAQGAGGVTKVQLDTSNCRVETDIQYTSLNPIYGGVAGGAFSNKTQYSQQTIFAYTVCD